MEDCLAVEEVVISSGSKDTDAEVSEVTTGQPETEMSPQLQDGIPKAPPAKTRKGGSKGKKDRKPRIPKKQSKTGDTKRAPTREEILPNVAQKAVILLKGVLEDIEGDGQLIAGDRINFRVTVTVQGCNVDVLSTTVLKNLIAESVEVPQELWKKITGVPWPTEERRIVSVLKRFRNQPKNIKTLGLTQELYRSMNAVLGGLGIPARLMSRASLSPKVAKNWDNRLVNFITL